MNTISEVWCAKCDQPTVEEVLLTTGERKAYCKKHLSDMRWLAASSGSLPSRKGDK